MVFVLQINELGALIYQCVGFAHVEKTNLEKIALDLIRTEFLLTPNLSVDSASQ